MTHHKEKWRTGGLHNLGNTCYMNAVLQALCHTPRFLKRVLTTVPEDRSAIASHLHDIAMETWFHARDVAPHALLKCLSERIPQMALRCQNDAQEFLVYLLDGLHAEAAVPAARLPSPPPWWYQPPLSSRFSYVIDMFYGKLETRIRCRSCGRDAVLGELFSTLAVQASSSIEESVRRAIESSDPIERRECDFCGRACPGTRETSLARAPKVLVLCVGPGASSASHAYKFRSLADKPLLGVYKLCGIVCHQGSAQTGHYFAICRKPDDGWQVIDDACVARVDPADDPLVKPYLLVYDAKKVAQKRT